MFGFVITRKVTIGDAISGAYQSGFSDGCEAEGNRRHLENVASWEASAWECFGCRLWFADADGHSTDKCMAAVDYEVWDADCPF